MTDVAVDWSTELMILCESITPIFREPLQTLERLPSAL